MFALLLPEAHLSFLGVGIEAKNMREALLLISAAVQSTMFFSFSEDLYNREITETYVARTGKEDEELKTMLKLSFGLGIGKAIPKLDIAAMTGRNISLFLLVSFCFLIWVLLSTVGLLGLHLASIVSILRSPTISFSVSLLLAFYVLAVDIMLYGLQIMNQTIAPFEGVGVVSELAKELGPDNRMGQSEK